MRVCPQVWSTAKNPMRAPRREGSAAIRNNVSETAEEQVVNHPRVLKRKLGKRIGEGEDNVVVGEWEQFSLPSF